ncbi:hypothetical protein CsSME_00001284 [Camellia sinensis var. sinensis]
MLGHKSWRVREEFARTVTLAIGLFASTELPLQRAILPPVVDSLGSHPTIRPMPHQQQSHTFSSQEFLIFELSKSIKTIFLTSEDYRFYAISTEFTEFSNKDNTLN